MSFHGRSDTHGFFCHIFCRSSVFGYSSTVAPRSPEWINFTDFIRSDVVSWIAEKIGDLRICCTVCSIVFLFSFHSLDFWPWIFSPFGIAFLVVIGESGPAGQLFIGTGEAFLRASCGPETCPFPVQRVKLCTIQSCQRFCQARRGIRFSTTRGSEVRLY